MADVLVKRHPELARLITTDQITRRVWRERFAGLERRRRRRAIERELERLEDRLLAFCEAFDRDSGLELPVVLLPLFRYGFVKGFAARTMPRGAANVVRAGWLLDHLAPALREFVARRDRAATPVPESTLRELIALR
jgi:hypothetical protein